MSATISKRPTADAERPAGRTVAARAPWIVLGLGALAVAVLSASVGARIGGLASLDELVYKVSAVTYSDGLPRSLVTDPVARGTARLYSLLLMPLFAAFDGDVALRVARALNGVLFAAAAVPVALLARRLTRSPWAAVAAGLLAVAVPWLTVTTILFSEALSYLLFCWAAYAMAVTLADPTPRRELAVLALLAALVATRVQFVGLPVAWVALVLLVERGRLRAVRERYPILSIVAGVAALGVLALLVTGQLESVFGRIGGPYSEIRSRGRLPVDTGMATMFHAGMLALGLGILPGILALAWLREALGRRAGTEAFRVAALSLALVAALFVVTVAAQDGWQAGRAEERYYLYAVPLIWIAAVAAVELRRIRPATLAWIGLGLAAVLALVPLGIPLSTTQALNGPVGSSAARLLTFLGEDLGGVVGLDAGPSARDMLAILTLAVAGLATFLWVRRPDRRWWALVVPVVVQLALCGYAFAVLRGNVEGIPGLPTGRDFAAQAWIDHATDERVTLVENRPSTNLDAYAHLVLFNDAVRDRSRVPSLGVRDPLYPVAVMPAADAQVDAELRLSHAPGQPLAVQAADSPLWQLDGESVATARARGEELVRVARPARVRWIARDLGEDGHIGLPGQLFLLGGHRATLVFGPVSPQVETRVRVRFGDVRETVRFPGDEQTVTVSACGRPGVARGQLTPLQSTPLPDGRHSAGVLRAVRVERC